ncbi:MAG TPA: hypothetical protein VGO84_16015, partial [Burkholderiales bacterium]|nr:hypothetical protein [Burkholderiales bacterium]
GRPSTLSFSPDGTKLAVGHRAGSNWVVVLSPDTLDTLYIASSAGLSNNVGSFGLSRLAWSLDGKTLYGGVVSVNKTTHFVRQWGDGGRANPADFPTPGVNGIVDIVELRDGGVAFATGAKVGIFDARGGKKRSLEADGGSFYGTTEAFKISRDGTRVQFAYDEGREVLNFDVLERKLAAGAVKGIAMAAPETNTRTMKFYNQWRDTRGALELNGRLLEGDGVSRSLAIAPDESGVVVGTDARAYYYGKDGAPLWNVNIGGNMAVNVSGDNRLVISAHGDGALRWYRRTDGRHLLTLFVAADRKRWALVSPSGFYDTSVGGEELLGWHVNRSREEAADFFPVSRLRARFYKPEVIADIIGKADDNEAFKLAAAALGDGAAKSPPPAPARTVDKPVVAAKPPVVAVAPPPVEKPVATKPVVVGPVQNNEKPPAPQTVKPAPVAIAPVDDDVVETSAPAAVQIVSDITRVLPPVVTVLSPASGSTVNTRQVTIKYIVKSSDDAPVTAVRTRVNGVGSENSDARGMISSVSREVTVDVPQEDSEVLLFAENKYGISTP